MSWSIHAKGTVREVREAVEKADCYEQRQGIPNTPNEAQLLAAKAGLLAELLRLPAEQEVFLEAAGHADDSGKSSTLNVRLEARMPVPKPIEAPAGVAGQVAA